MEPSQDDATPKRHSRTNSARSPRPRRSTRGPLDLSQAPVSGTSSPTASQFFSPPQTPALTPFTTAPTYPAKEFPKLLRPEIYHPLTHLTTPAPFRSSSVQPSPETPIQTLLATGHFRAAAITAAQLLTTSTSPSDIRAIFSLLYIRLACLTLCGSTALAAQEATALEDLNSSIYRDEVTGAHVVPWELRVLAVRLQGVGFNDPRKGVMGYYDLAREVRIEISKLRGKEGNASADRAMLEARLADLGIRVASALVEMGDLDGAVCHLSDLSAIPFQFQQLRLQKALLWLQLGDVAAARRCVVDDNDSGRIVLALSDMADGEYAEAAEAWKKLCESDKSNSLYSQNLAVCLLYSGLMAEARAILEGLVDQGNGFHALTFNLSTIYELCSDKSRSLKLRLAEQVATFPDQDGMGWEKSLMDFKL